MPQLLVFSQFDQDSARALWVEESNALSFGPKARDLVDEDDVGGPTTIECGIEIVDGETQVMDTGSAFVEELRNRGVGAVWLEQFDKRIAGGITGNACTIRIAERHVGQSEDIVQERAQRVERRDGETNVCNAGAAAGLGGHGRTG